MYEKNDYIWEQDNDENLSREKGGNVLKIWMIPFNP